jgi:hypothetical protein
MAALDDMVRLVRNKDSWASGHGCTRVNGTAGSIMIARCAGALQRDGFGTLEGSARGV